ncbi:diguanylate cyclase (GGDEF)-like protein/PAS domain S-box-containing protein [Methylobacterium sp. BE186]|uniref:putative bifunctional diguanylate cyclase/phosphodiesterase n=1 Tax=Methylobacterium sp. BE186 TaxID=2817715 RepID=UPI00285A9EC9|nr:EAL domain-containing protein [Methylobacterium sp. BE186]MDR7038441.1 diguanylate cyclase (GGDEF)-like protein/PAS domain S-box-containing protein [Methylobacterium sp. BE186]
MAAPDAVDANLMYRLLVQGVTDYAIYMLDPQGVISNWNAGAERAKGYRAHEIVGRHFSCFYGQEERSRGVPHQGLETARRTGRFEAEGWRVRKDGSRFWAHVVIEAIHGEDGRLLGFAKITRDCTERRLQAERLEETSANLDLALAHMSQGLCLVDARRRLILCNARFREILVLDAALTQRGTPLSAILRRLIRDEGVGSGEPGARPLRPFRPAGAAIPLSRDLTRQGRTIAVTTRALPTGGWVSTVEDVTERRRIEDSILHMAHHDALTGLPNRTAFGAHLERALAANGATAVLCLDLDRFKAINDTFGHPAGDALLRTVAERLRGVLRGSGMIARLGGDEFVVALAGTGDGRPIEGLAERLIEAVGQPLEIDGHLAHVGVSVGIAVGPRDGADPDTLFRNADIALYRAKAAGRNTYRFYETGMDALAAARNLLQLELRDAVQTGELRLHYQPVMDLRRGGVGGFEALLRWPHPQRGSVPPDTFIPIAEETGLITRLGAWVLREACREAAVWPEEIRVAVNVSAVQFARGSLEEVVTLALAVSGLAPHRLELEITESVLMSDSEAVVACLHRLRRMGVRVALDDFGTGHSSLSYLRLFPFDRIKIDRSFIREIGRPENVAIVRAVRALAADLGAAITVEGIETQEQLAFVRGLDCEEAQGFLFSRPLPASDLAPFLATRPTARAA